MNRPFPEAFNPFTTTLTDLFIFSVKTQSKPRVCENASFLLVIFDPSAHGH